MTMRAPRDIITVYECFWEGETMRGTESELYREAVAPVIIGNGHEAHRICRRLFLERGLASVLCGERRSLFDLLFVGCGFCRVSEEYGRLTLEQLIDISDRWNENILVLIPATERAKGFVEEYHPELEARYLICEDGRAEELCERWVCGENE